MTKLRLLLVALVFLSLTCMSGKSPVPQNNENLKLYGSTKNVNDNLCKNHNVEITSYYHLVSCPWELGKDTQHTRFRFTNIKKNDNIFQYEMSFNDGTQWTVKIHNNIITEISVYDKNGKIQRKVTKPEINPVSSNKQWIEMSINYYDIILDKISFFSSFDKIKKDIEYEVVTRREQGDLYTVKYSWSNITREVRFNKLFLRITDSYGSETVVDAKFDSNKKVFGVCEFFLAKHFNLQYYPGFGLKAYVALDQDNKFTKTGTHWDKSGQVTGKRDFNQKPFDFSEFKIVK